MNRFICYAFSFFLAVPVLNQYRNSALDQGRDLTRQAEAKEKVSRLIGSASNRDRAWAAYLIGQYELKEYAPALIDLLDSTPLDPPAENAFVRLATLDSLIRLRMNVPSDRVMPLYKSFPDQVLIILAMSVVESRDALLSVAQEPGREVCWVAAFNLLTESKAPGLAAVLLKDVKIKIDIAVSEGNKGYVSGGLWSCVSDGVWMTPDGFPPTALYKLIDTPKRDAVVIAPGAHPVFYERQTVEPSVSNQRGFGAVDNGVDRDRYRLEYLAALLDQHIEELRLREKYYHSFTWAGAERYIREVARIREGVIKDSDELKKRLVEKGLLSDS